MYEFVQKISKKERKRKLGFQPGTNMACNRRSSTPFHHPSSFISAHFIYIPYNKKTIRKSGYEFVCMNSYKKLAKKKKKESWDFNPGPIWLAIVAAARHPPPLLLHKCPFYLYTVQ